MLRLKQFQVDAFASRVFEGNPAAVCPLHDWLPDGVLQSIAAENNLSETAFFVPSRDGYHLRWFTPLTEVDFCGHATLATAHVLFAALGYAGDAITFDTRSGKMVVQRDGDAYRMDFPARPVQPCTAPRDLLAGLGAGVRHTLAGDDYVAVFDDEAQVRSLQPDLSRLAALDRRGVIATAPGREVDFVSRFFAPRLGIDEDPVTGSAHCELVPYWADKLGRTSLRARQVSRRGGELLCELAGGRVILTAGAVIFMEGEIRV